MGPALKILPTEEPLTDHSRKGRDEERLGKNWGNSDGAGPDEITEVIPGNHPIVADSDQETSTPGSIIEHLFLLTTIPSIDDSSLAFLGKTLKTS